MDSIIVTITPIQTQQQTSNKGLLYLALIGLGIGAILIISNKE